MARIKITLQSTGTCVADRCELAESFLARLRGLIGRKSLEAGEGMLFPRCNDIHMWFMSIPIDVVFLKPGASGDGRLHEVCSTREELRPWRALPVRDGSARDTLELPAGTVRKHKIAAGDILCIA